MPTEILISSNKFYNQLKCGLGFGSITDGTDNLAGSVAERLRMETTIDLRWYFTSNDSNPITLVGIGGSQFTMTRLGGSWIADGFCVGDTIHVEDTASYSHGTATVNSVSALVLLSTLNTGSVYDDVYPTDSPIVRYPMTVYGTNQLTALILKFGLINNSETFNILSKVSQNEQAYYASGIGASAIPMNRVGNYDDWNSGVGASGGTEATVKYVSTTGMWQRFTITHQFVINPWYLEEWIPNFDDSTIPTLLAGLQSLKYVYECEFRSVLSNPNTSKIARVENVLGSVGWYDENYNGFNNVYSIDSIAYEDTTLLTTVGGLQKGARTTATITVSKTGGAFGGGHPFGAMVSICPDSTDYKNTVASNLEGNFLYDDGIANEGGASTQGTNNIIKELSGNIVAGKLVIEVQVEWDTTQQLLIPDGTKFILSVLVADNNLTSGNSDKVLLLADYAEVVASADIEDLLCVTNFEIYQHPTDPATQTGVTKCEPWNEDGLCLKYNFWLDLNKDAVLNSLRFLVIAYDTTTGDYFTLDEYAVNLNGVIISGGVQQINIADTRGYKLLSSDYFGKVLVTTGANVANKQYYEVFLGQKIPWQDWLLNLDVDTIFYNSSKPNNNLNYKTSNYSDLNNYEIKFALLANVAGTSPLSLSGNTDYLVISPSVTNYDYDLPATWDATLETFYETATTNLGGAIRTDTDTFFRITWVRSGPFNVGYNFWGIHRIEESQESGKNIYELSSIVDSVTNNLLKPVVGETYLKITVTPGSNTVVTECLIDYTKLDNTKTYKLSGRIDDGLATGGLPDGKLTEEDELKITEDGETKVLE